MAPSEDYLLDDLLWTKIFHFYFVILITTFFVTYSSKELLLKYTRSLKTKFKVILDLNEYMKLAEAPLSRAFSILPGSCIVSACRSTREEGRYRNRLRIGIRPGFNRRRETAPPDAQPFRIPLYLVLTAGSLEKLQNRELGVLTWHP